MELIITIAICILALGVESQSYFGENQQYNEQYTESSRVIYPENQTPNVRTNLNYSASIDNISYVPNVKFGSTAQTDKQKITERDSYLQAISRNDNTQEQQAPNHQEGVNNDRIYFIQPNVDLTPPAFAENASPNYYSTHQNNKVLPSTSEQQNINNAQETVTPGADNSVLNNVTISVANFGLQLIKVASQLTTGNVIVSPTSIATLLALLQQAAVGETQEQITRSLQMTPDASINAFSTITTNMHKKNSRNILSIANSMFVSDAFELNTLFKRMAISVFWTEVSATSFANPSEAIVKINAWVASKTSNKIANLLAPGAVTPTTQLVLLNAVYFKGLWETKFKPERTQNEKFHLGNGDTKVVPFMHTRHAFQVGYDRNTRALVTILPFEGHQYSLILILPKKFDNVANLLSTLTVEQLLYYQTFEKSEITVILPKFTLKSDTDLSPVLRNMGITNILGSTSDLAGIGLYRTTPPQISSAIHSGFLSIDEQGVTAAAATAFVAVALSYDDSSITFRADRPFVAVLWDNQLSIPIFIAKIEDPS